MIASPHLQIRGEDTKEYIKDKVMDKMRAERMKGGEGEEEEGEKFNNRK